MEPLARLAWPLVTAALWLAPLSGCAQSVSDPRAGLTQRGGADPAAAARLVVEQTNEFRRQEGRRPLSAQPALTETALEFARYMARTGRFGHTADGNEPAGRAVAHGYAYCIVAENIGEYRAAGLGTPELATALQQGWERSPEHRENLLDADVTEIGVGIARNDATGSYLGVQMFGLPKSASIDFTLANRTAAAVGYRLGGDAFTLPPNTVRTHQTCGAATLELDQGPAAQPRPVHAGDHLAIVRASNGALEIQSDRSP